MKMFNLMARKYMSDQVEIFNILDIPIIITKDNGLILQNKPNSVMLDGNSVMIGSDTGLFIDDLIELSDGSLWFINYYKGFKAYSIEGRDVKRISEIPEYKLVKHYSGYVKRILTPKFRLSGIVFIIKDILYKTPNNYLMTRSVIGEITEDTIQQKAHVSLNGKKLFLNQDGLEIVNGDLGYFTNGQFKRIEE